MKKVPASDIKTYASGNSLVPAGSVTFAGALLQQGFIMSRTSRFENYLCRSFALGGDSSPYGLPDSSTFNLPDLRGRVVAGKDDMGSVSKQSY